MANQRIQQLEFCHREMFGNMIITCANPDVVLPKTCSELIQPVTFPLGIVDKKKSTMALRRTRSCSYEIHITNPENEKRRSSALVDELLLEIYHSMHNGTTDYYSTSGKSQKSAWMDVVDLHEKDVNELHTIIRSLRDHIARTGSVLVRQLKRRDALRRQQQAHCDVISRTLSHRASESVDMRFTIQPIPGDSGFSQWVAAMKMVAQLPGGIPSEFRRRLWITMAERHLASRGVDSSQVEKSCFSEWSHPADAELGIQIVKDLHRTGCSLFCGEDGQENQALLKKVLLAYARWNKAVGYCQGFNMLAALILQVTDRSESDALKLMIYLIEGVLPDSYFADSLRGLSVDMAVFRELLRSKLPRLSKHLDLLQNAAKDGSRSYEPPLTNVFTMQWFLTLFCNCLPQPTVLRVWDLIFLEGNEILLRTAVAIWQVLAQRILVVRTADEFYCVMGALTRELLESNLIDANTLVKAIVTIGPLTELKSLRNHYLYNITPWGTSIPQSNVNKQISLHPKHSIPLDISALKKQYMKLKQRQRQAHVIFSSAISRHPPRAAPVAMNHLLVGKRALGPSKRLAPPKGSIPPARHVHPSTIHWKDTQKPSSSSSSSDTELCDDDVQSSSDDEDKPIKSQLTDNLNSTGDTNLMTISDNTVSASKNSENDNSNAAILAIPTEAETRDSLSPSPINLKLASDSEDESAEFESFLADRVKCFKESDIDPSGDVVSVSSYTRRNSELALQIIQENSLILHRIMQCQSRLSPSPPPLFTEAMETLEQSDIDTDIQKMENVYSWIDSQTEPEFNNSNYNDTECMSEKQHESRYHSILEKSKSLDERYNSLFSSSYKDKIPPLLGGLHESKSETPVGCGANDLLNSPSDIVFFESDVPKRDSEDTLVLPSMSDDGTKDSRSSKLIQENLDLLKAFSDNKAKEQQQERSHLSKMLIRENVSLLESISSEKNSSNTSEDPVMFPKDISGNLNSPMDDVCGATTSETFKNILSLSHESKAEEKDHSKEYFLSEKSSKMADIDSLSDFLTITTSEKETIDDNGSREISRELPNVNYEDKDSAIVDFCTTNSSEKGSMTDDDFRKPHNINFKDKDSAIGDFLLTTTTLKNELRDDDGFVQTHKELPNVKLENKDSAISVDDRSISESSVVHCLVNLEDDFSDLCSTTRGLLSPIDLVEAKNEIDYACDKSSIVTSPSSPTKYIFSVKPSSPNSILSTTSPTFSRSIFLEQPTKTSDCDESINLNRSPSRAFSPFPVALNSRQNKEVPVKLGLYKK